jgi:hypothetical protein
VRSSPRTDPVMLCRWTRSSANRCRATPVPR